jgi:hypothetical protein
MPEPINQIQTQNVPATTVTNPNNYPYNYDDDYYEGYCRRNGWETGFTNKSNDKAIARVEELNDELCEKFDKRAIVVLEKLRGLSIRVMFDGKTYKFGNRWGNLKDDLESQFMIKSLVNYKDEFIKLAEKISVPFCLFGELINNEISKEISYFKSSSSKAIYFHDIFLNENWMCWDDFSNLMESVELLHVPLIKLINFDEEEIKKLANAVSMTSELPGQLMEGIIIRPFIEDSEYSSRLIAKVTNSPFVEKRIFNSSNSIKKETSFIYKNSDVLVYTIAGSILDKFCTEARTIYWKHELDIKNIQMTESNIYKILSMLVKISIKDLASEIDSTITKIPVNKKLLVKELKRELPKRITKSLILNFPQKAMVRV